MFLCGWMDRTRDSNLVSTLQLARLWARHAIQSYASSLESLSSRLAILRRTLGNNGKDAESNVPKCLTENTHQSKSFDKDVHVLDEMRNTCDADIRDSITCLTEAQCSQSRSGTD